MTHGHRIRILLLAANPRSTGEVNAAQEAREIREKLSVTAHRDAIELIERFAVRAGDIQKAIFEVQPHIVHFSGHGTADGELVLEGDDGRPEPLGKRALADIFRVHKDLIRVVLLSACHSRPQVEALSEHIECAIGMRRAIGSRAAIEFSAAFYLAIGFGSSVHKAFESGIAELRARGIPEDSTPQLIVRPGTDATQVTLLHASPLSETAPWVESGAARDQPPKERSKEVIYTISPALRGRLVAITGTAEWSPEDLATAYNESAPPEWRSRFDRGGGADLVQRMLGTLAGVLGQSDGVHPILRFALHLAKRASAPPLHDALSEWVADAAAYLSVDPPRLHALQQAIAGAPRKTTRELHLVVLMKEIAAEPDHYAVSAFRILVPYGKQSWSDEDARPAESAIEPGYTLDQMPALLNALLEELSGDLALSDNKLMIELVVPLGLLDHAADRWVLDLGMDTTSFFGVEYKLIVRSWERAYGKDRQRLIPRWSAKWQRVHHAHDGVAWACAHEDAGAGLTSKLHADGPACVALRFAPPKDAAKGTSSVLRALVATGTPVAVWPREHPRDEARTKAFIEDLITAPPPRAWPQAVKNLRVEAHEEADVNHPGHHLTVLWDDPNKLVPDMRPEARLASPTKMRNVQS